MVAVAYDVTVLTQPVGQTCAVANGSGTIDVSGDDVSSVSVSCAASASVAAPCPGWPSARA